MKHFLNLYTFFSLIIFFFTFMYGFIGGTNQYLDYFLIGSFINCAISVYFWNNYKPKSKNLIEFKHNGQNAIGLIYNSYPENPNEGIEVVGAVYDDGSTTQLKLSEIKTFKFI